jgi:predicted anti-sigma-YlaC factor YlaD
MTTHEACREYESMLARAADGSLDRPGQARLDAHLVTCAACREALADQRAVRVALTDRPALRAHPEFAVRVMQAIEAEPSWLVWLDFRQWTWRLAPLAAGMMIVAYATGTTDTAGTTGTAGTLIDESLPVSAALWQESVDEVALLSLMLNAGADDKLADSISKER